MVYRDILVHVPLLGSRTQVNVAIALAKRFGARLTGVCCLSETAILKHLVGDPLFHLGKDEADTLIKKERDEAAVAGRRFSAAAEAAGVDHAWLVGEGETADVLVRACRLQDLAVVEQGAVSPGDLFLGPAVQLAISGHPTLVVPNLRHEKIDAGRVLIAWNGSAQAAAAVRAARPFLSQAERVTVLQGPSREVFPTVDMPPIDLLGYLRSHGIEAAATSADAPDAEAGAAILKAASEAGVDLIVMGAFGRSRFREWVLGGATRTVLENTTVPVLMAH